MKRSFLVVVCFCVSVYSGLLLASNDLVSSELESLVIAKNMAMSKDSESIEDAIKTIHPESSKIVDAKSRLEKRFLAADMNFSTVDFHFIGLSSDYAFARFKIKMEKISGPMSFKSHVSEYIYVFKKDQGKWKIWEGVRLDIDYL